ncbi:uncharacterized protein [Henckelia pumila]|uniref:uncharacterized protein n=1 Tax=Henckelia pumila TaxID=405737 RepID=UPI003C6EA1A9
MRNVLVDGQIMLADYKKAVQELSSVQQGSSLDSLSRWEVPPEGQLRLNVDASFNEIDNRGGIGGVIRNHLGQPLVAFGNSISMPESVVMGELLAIKEGIRIVRDKDFKQVIISSDFLFVGQAVTESYKDLSYVGVCAKEIDTMCVDLGILSVFHVRRSANSVAHYISKFACFSPTPFSWVSENFPSWLITLVMNDISQKNYKFALVKKKICVMLNYTVRN